MKKTSGSTQVSAIHDMGIHDALIFVFQCWIYVLFSSWVLHSAFMGASGGFHFLVTGNLLFVVKV